MIYFWCFEGDVVTKAEPVNSFWPLLFPQGFSMFRVGVLPHSAQVAAVSCPLHHVGIVSFLTAHLVCRFWLW